MNRITIHFVLGLLGVSVFFLGFAGMLVYIITYKNWAYVLLSNQDLQLLMNPIQHLIIGCCIMMAVALDLLDKKK